MTLDVGAAVAIDADKVQPGPVALLFVVGLGVALVLLLRSLNKQLKRVDFERPEPGAVRPDRQDRLADGGGNGRGDGGGNGRGDGGGNGRGDGGRDGRRDSGPDDQGSPEGANRPR